MGFPKALLRYRDETFLDTLIGLFAPRCRPVIVVLGAHSDRIRERTVRPATFVINPDYQRGQTSSMQCGLRAVPPDAGGVLFTLVDHPAVAPATLDALLAEPEPQARSAPAGPRAAPRRAAADTPSGFPATSSPSSWPCPRMAPPAKSSAATPRKPNFWTSTMPASWRISTMPPPTAASPEPPYEAPPRPALQDCRRAAPVPADRRLRGARFHRRPVRPPPAGLARARSRPARRNRQSPLQSLQRPRLLGGQRHHLRRPLHRHGARRVYPGARLHGSRAQHLVAPRRQVRDRLHPPGWRQHQPHQIRSRVGVGALEFFVHRQSLR